MSGGDEVIKKIIEDKWWRQALRHANRIDASEEPENKYPERYFRRRRCKYGSTERAKLQADLNGNPDGLLYAPGDDWQNEMRWGG